MASRRVVEADARVWLAENTALPDTSVVTSMPDISEVPLDFDAWRAWFIATAHQILTWIPREGVAIFYQSDIRQHGAWIDKGYLVTRAAEDAKLPLVWHKIVHRAPPGTIAFGRASYSHMLCFAATPSLKKPGPDIFGAGPAAWTRGMGIEACRVACRYLVENTSTRVVVDPFCGKGTTLAVANDMGLDAVGVELNAKRCRQAQRLVLSNGELVLD